VNAPRSSGCAVGLAWQVASRPVAGQQECGDVHVVEPYGDGALVAVADGVGHGAEAAAAARRAADTLRAHAREPLDALVARCHRALIGTRGAVMSVAAFDFARGRMSWTGVGNVEGKLLHASGAPAARERLLLRAGVLGHELPSLRVTEIAIAAGDLLILATDGIRPDFAVHLNRNAPLRSLADSILADYARATDDGLVLVARCEAA
jgi:phosphoserine phosphatase RsbX